MSTAASNASLSQTNRPVVVTSTAGDNVLAFRRMTFDEGLSQLFCADLELVSETHDLAFDDLLGTAMAASLELPTGDYRYYHGYVTQFQQLEGVGTLARYRAVLRPWLWFLGQTSDCKIFSEQSIPDIIKAVFKDHGFSGQVTDHLNGTYDALTYCVQYRETDLDFVLRLMERAGIYFYFVHEANQHTLVLADDNNNNTSQQGYETVVYSVQLPGRRTDKEVLESWAVSGQVLPQGYASTAFDFEAPQKNLKSSATVSQGYSWPNNNLHEIFDYPGPYSELAAGNRHTQVRAEAQQAHYSQVEATGNALGLCCGRLFSLEKHPRDDQNREHLIIATQVVISVQTYESGTGGGDQYRVNLKAIPSDVTFKPLLITPKPTIPGPQTATVVGKKGEEIWTDQYGRVKCQFHWDRYGESDENSSCWIRVAQVWAGKKWGGLLTPRIGQEVIVEFLEGDPDRPIVTGRVYNGEALPPYTLPTNATQSGILSRSSKSGAAANANEIFMEDKKGSEELRLHAERLFTVGVEEDEFHDVGRNRTRKVKGNETVAVGGNRTAGVTGNETTTINGEQTLIVDKDREATVKGKESLTVEGNLTMDHQSKVTHDIGSGRTTTVKSGNDATDVSSGKATIDAATGIELTVGANSIKISATGVTITVGANSVKVSQTGVEIKGVQVKAQGTAMFEAKAPMVTVEGQGMNTVKSSGILILQGTLTKIN